MSEMTDEEVAERLGRYRAVRRRNRWILGLVLAAVVACACAWIAASVSARREAREAESAARAALEALSAKPVAEWTAEEKDSHPDLFAQCVEAELAAKPLAAWSRDERDSHAEMYARRLREEPFVLKNVLKTGIAAPKGTVVPGEALRILLWVGAAFVAVCLLSLLGMKCVAALRYVLWVAGPALALLLFSSAALVAWRVLLA